MMALVGASQSDWRLVDLSIFDCCAIPTTIGLLGARDWRIEYVRCILMDWGMGAWLILYFCTVLRVAWIRRSCEGGSSVSKVSQCVISWREAGRPGGACTKGLTYWTIW